MKLVAIALIGCALYGQQTVSLRVTGHLQSVKTTRSDVGRLSKGYRIADWTVSTEPPTAMKVPLEWILQRIKVGNGITVLSPNSSLSVVQDAQGRDPINTITRVGLGLIGTVATCETIKVCGSGGAWGKAVFGSEIAALLIQGVLPALPTHTLRSITSMMPNPISLDAQNLYTQPGWIVVEIDKHTPEPPALDETIQVTIPK